MKLEKNTIIKLERRPNSRTHTISMGINWGALQKRTFFRTVHVPVDLDACASLFKEDGEFDETVSFKNKASRHFAVMHSGDDKDGDVDGDDEQDNETIILDLSRVDRRVSMVFLFVTSYNEFDFAHIPHANVRAYAHSDHDRRDLLAQFDIKRDPSFSGCKSMVLGVIFRRGQEWLFRTIGEPTKGKTIRELELIIQEQYIGQH